MALFPEDKAFDDVLEQRLKSSTTCENCNTYNETSWIHDIFNLAYLNEKHNFLNDADTAMLHDECANLETRIRDYNIQHYFVSEHLHKIKLYAENLTEKWDSCSDVFKQHAWCIVLQFAYETFNAAPNTLVRSCLLEVLTPPEHRCITQHSRFALLDLAATNLCKIIQQLRAHTAIPIEERNKYKRYTQTNLYLRLGMLVKKASRCENCIHDCKDFLHKLKTILIPILFCPFQNIPIPPISDYEKIPHIIDLGKETPSFADTNRSRYIH